MNFGIHDSLPLSADKRILRYDLHIAMTCFRWGRSQNPIEGDLGKLAKALGVRSMTVARWEWGTIRIPALLPLALEALEHRLKTEGKARGWPIP